PAAAPPGAVPPRARLKYAMPHPAARQNATTPAYTAAGASSAGNASASSHTVPAPPNPLWLIPSPMNAQRRDTTKTLSTAQATATAQVVGTSVKNTAARLQGTSGAGSMGAA